MTRRTNLLIICAGPFGLAMAAHAQARGIDHLVLGKPMEFWKSNMPAGMLLRSACDWHLDPLGEHTIEAYLQTQNRTPADVEPLSLAFYLEYTQWFQEQKGIEALPTLVQRLDVARTGEDRFVATLADEETIVADQVVLALGFQPFRNVPAEIAAMVPADRLGHTCDLVDLPALAGKRCLIVGGRQSAYEWAALLHENGAAAVHMTHRHPMPAFTESDWSWATPLIEKMVENPGWYRSLSPADREAINQRFWGEGRLKLEPWLWPRINKENVTIWPETHIVACTETPANALEITLNTGQTLAVDQVVLATGYTVNMAQVPLLANGSLLDDLETRNGFPVLDEHMQSSIPGLFITSMPATQDFGSFFAFTVSAVASAKIIGQAL